LQEGIEKRMTESFAKITTQFAEVQQAVGEVKNVAGQVGDLKRLFSNVKSRGGWGEAQVKATLDDILPANS
jgi:DNA recombination protein RmuC